MRLKYADMIRSFQYAGKSLAFMYRVILKSLQDFRPLRYSSRDGHAEGEHVNRGRVTPSFFPTLQVLDMSTLGDAADVNPIFKFLPHTCCARVWQFKLQEEILLSF